MLPKSAQSFTHIRFSEANLCLTLMDGFDHKLQSIMRLRREVNLFIIIGHFPPHEPPTSFLHAQELLAKVIIQKTNDQYVPCTHLA